MTDCEVVVVAGSEDDGETALVVETASEVIGVSGSGELEAGTLDKDYGSADEVVRVEVKADDARVEDDEGSLDDESTGVEVEIASIYVDDAVGVAEQ